MSKTTIFYDDTAPGSAADAEFACKEADKISNLDLLRRENDLPPLATCEPNAWFLDGSFDNFDGQDIPLWSTDLSDAECGFTDPPVLEVTFSQRYASLGITLVFDPGLGTWCSDVNVKWYHGEQLLADEDYAPTGYKYTCRRRVEGYDHISVTFRKTALPYRRVKLHQVIFGMYRIFDMAETRSVRAINQMNSVALELPVSTMSWTLDSDDELGFMFQFKQPIEVSNDGKTIGVYYITDHTRRSRRLYDIQGQDILGVLDGDTFSGGIYRDYSAMRLVRDIVGPDVGVDFTDVDDTTLTGALLPATKRAALQQVLFAWGVCAATDGGSVIRVSNLDTTPIVIGPDRIYTGASVSTSGIVTAVKVTAHTYTQAEDGSVEINGVKYADTVQVFTVTNPEIMSSTRPNVKEVKAATLISPGIGQAVAQRVYDYYVRRNTASAKIVWRGELLGDCVTIPSLWDEVTGNIEKMEYVISNTVAATVEVPG